MGFNNETIADTKYIQISFTDPEGNPLTEELPELRSRDIKVENASFFGLEKGEKQNQWLLSLRPTHSDKQTATITISGWDSGRVTVDEPEKTVVIYKDVRKQPTFQARCFSGNPGVADSKSLYLWFGFPIPPEDFSSDYITVNGATKGDLTPTSDGALILRISISMPERNKKEVPIT